MTPRNNLAYVRNSISGAKYLKMAMPFCTRNWMGVRNFTFRYHHKNRHGDCSQQDNKKSWWQVFGIMHYLIRYAWICINARADIHQLDEARFKMLVLSRWHSRSKDISSVDFGYLFLPDPGRHTRGCVRVSFCRTAGPCHFGSRLHGLTPYLVETCIMVREGRPVSITPIYPQVAL